MHKIITLKFAVLLFCFASLNAFAQSTYYIPDHASTADYEKGVVYFKLKEQFRHLENNPLSENRLMNIYQAIGGNDVRKSFPNAVNPRGKQNEMGLLYEDLSMIYVLQFDSQYHVAHAMQLLQKTGLVEYAQPRYYVKPLFTPNDPQHTQQYYLSLIKAYEAWDITQGDTNICIGIVDGGIQFTHQDLMANIKYNYDDPINGLDDDGDGYVDNFRGWNFGNNTNDPTASLSPHGVFVSGISSATPNNNIGITGAAFNTKYLSVRIDNAQGWGFGYEGIVYSADMGCEVINASWGNTFYSPMNEAVVRYATINKNAIVICAAGNSNLNEKFYPASYQYAISVAASNQSDVKWGNSTFSTAADIAAPGENIRSTWPFNAYDNSSGTSFAAPQVSAAAALLKAHKPNYNAIQLGERLKVTADTSIYTIAGNDQYYHQLGFGRLNILRALTDPDRPSIVASNISINGTVNEKIAAGTQATIKADFTNYLEIASNLSISLVSESPYFTVISPAIQVGALGMLEIYSNNELPFVVEVAADAPINAFAELKFVFRADDYFGYQYFQIDANLDYMDLAVNNITTTITSKGDLGYNQPYQMFGKGFQWNESASLLSYSGLMLGTSPSKVSNNTYSNTIPVYDRHFKPIDIVSLIEETSAEREIGASFSDEMAEIDQLPVIVRQKAFAYNSTGNENYIIKEFTIINSGSQPLQNLYAGNFTDWSIGNYTQNQAKFIPDANMVYAFSTVANEPMTAIKLLSSSAANAYCMNADGINGSISFYDGFSTEEKFQTLTGEDQRHETVTGDIATIISQGPFQIFAGDSVTVAFAFIAGEDLTSLLNSGNQAQASYLFRATDFEILTEPVTCAGDAGSISVIFNSGDLQNIAILDADNTFLGAEDFFETIEFSDLQAGDYFLRFNYNDSIYVDFPFYIDALPSVSASIITSQDELFLPGAVVTLSADANNAEIYQWTVDGNELEGASISYEFNSPGSYEIMLIAYNASCADTAFSSILVSDTSTSVSIIEWNSLLNIFPNPTSDFIQISFSENFGQTTYSISDLNGRILESKQFEGNQHIVNLKNYSKGVYLIEIRSNGQNHFRKLIKH